MTEQLIHRWRDDVRRAAEWRSGDDPEPVLDALALTVALELTGDLGRVAREERDALRKVGQLAMLQLGGPDRDEEELEALRMCAAIARDGLRALGGRPLPDEPLIASIPVSMRTAGGAGGEGNAITFVLCNLGTHLADPEARLETITSSMRATKAVMADRSGLQLAALGILTTIGPSALTRVPGASSAVPPYNVLISNVPGPRDRLYWNGAELEAIYPLSIPTENQALNITCQSYDGYLNFGFTGCRDSLPHMQRVATYTGDALRELEAALAASQPRRKAGKSAGKRGGKAASEPATPPKAAAKRAVKRVAKRTPTRTASAKPSAPGKKKPAAAKPRLKKRPA